MTAMLMISDKRSITFVASSRAHRYGLPVAANSATGRRNPMSKRRNSAQITTAGVFFRLQFCVMAAVCGQASAWPGSFCPGIPTPCTAATQSRRKDRGSSSKAKGAPRMPALNPSAIRAFAHRRMALSALRANSSLSVRLARYNSHMAIARTLESAGRAQ
ncbi:ash family protein [Pseudomonas sp. E6002]|nr:ash family protein [Pseudomonas sp. E6002]